MFVTKPKVLRIHPTISSRYRSGSCTHRESVCHTLATDLFQQFVQFTPNVSRDTELSATPPRHSRWAARDEIPPEPAEAGPAAAADQPGDFPYGEALPVHEDDRPTQIRVHRGGHEEEICAEMGRIDRIL